jgi:hypothetical protein
LPTAEVEESPFDFGSMGSAGQPGVGEEQAGTAFDFESPGKRGRAGEGTADGASLDFTRGDSSEGLAMRLAVQSAVGWLKATVIFGAIFLGMAIVLTCLTGLLGGVVGGVGVLPLVFVGIAAQQLRRRGSYGLTLTGAILALVMGVLALGSGIVNGLYGLGLGSLLLLSASGLNLLMATVAGFAGIKTLRLLGRPEVKESFARTAERAEQRADEAYRREVREEKKRRREETDEDRPRRRRRDEDEERPRRRRSAREEE